MNITAQKILFILFILAWGVGVLLFASGYVLRLLRSDQSDPAARFLDVLSASNTEFHPDGYDAISQDFAILMGDDLNSTRPVHLMANAGSAETEPPGYNIMRRLFPLWYYPRTVAQVCLVTTAEALTAQCQPPPTGSIIVGFGFETFPGFTCTTGPEAFVICR